MVFLVRSDVFDEKRTTPPVGAPQQKTVKAPHIAMRGKRLPLYIDVHPSVKMPDARKYFKLNKLYE